MLIKYVCSLLENLFQMKIWDVFLNMDKIKLNKFNWSLTLLREDFDKNQINFECIM